MQLDIDRVTAQALAEFERTDVGITVASWLEMLVEERKERLARHRGIASIPDMWHDQGFIDGVRSVAYLFEHAATIVGEEPDEDDANPLTSVEVPDPDYVGADPDQPRR